MAWAGAQQNKFDRAQDSPIMSDFDCIALIDVEVYRRTDCRPVMRIGLTGTRFASR
jgi:hypothetical protein